MEDQYRFVKFLSDDIKASILEYTGNAYERINKKLRDSRTGDLTQIERSIVVNLDRAFEAVPPLEEPMTVYRGIRSNSFELISSFVSTSKNKKQALDFVKGGKCCLLNITVSPGTKILPVDVISDSPSEEEVLLSRDTQFVITNTLYNETEKLQEYFLSTMPGTSTFVTKRTKVSEVKKEFSVEQWAERIISLYEPDILILTETVREAVKFIVSTSFTEPVPKEAVEMATRRLEAVMPEK